VRTGSPLPDDGWMHLSGTMRTAWPHAKLPVSSLRSDAWQLPRILVQNKFISSIADVVAPGAVVKVRVLSVDAASGKIALTMKTGACPGHNQTA